MAFIEQGNTALETAMREQIDAALMGAVNLARDNNLTVLRLRDILLGTPAGEQRPEQPVSPGWFGEIRDIIGVTVDYMTETSAALNAIAAEVNSPTTKMTPVIGE